MYCTNWSIVFRTQSTLNGECEVDYEISPLPEVILQQQPELAPLMGLQHNCSVLDIVKSVNFSSCDERRALHFGVSGLEQFEPGQNKMGEFLAVSK